MDNYAYRVGNALVGNDLAVNPASIEFAITGGVVKFTQPTIVSVTGGRVDLKRNEEAIDQDQPIYVKKNDILDFSHIKAGRFVYLNVAGGFQVEEVMASRSTTLAVSLGGFHGRQLQTGDELGLVDLTETGAYHDKCLDPQTGPTGTTFNPSQTIRVVPGPEADWFDQSEWEKLLHQPFHLSQHINRMGFRLNGPQLGFKNENLLSEANLNGGIQIARDGQAIILLADRATHGGYPVIAKVIQADLGILAQWPQSQPLAFEKVSLAEAWQSLQDQQNLITQIARQRPWQLVLPQRPMASRIEELMESVK